MLEDGLTDAEDGVVLEPFLLSGNRHRHLPKIFLNLVEISASWLVLIVLLTVCAKVQSLVQAPFAWKRGHMFRFVSKRTSVNLGQPESFPCAPAKQSAKAFPSGIDQAC